MKYDRVNIGAIIKQCVDDRCISHSAFAKSIGLKRQNVDKTVFEKTSIDTNLLCTISEVLKEDFFKYYRLDSQTDCNMIDYNNSNDIKAVLTIELKKEKKEQVLRLVFGDNNLEILNK